MMSLKKLLNLNFKRERGISIYQNIRELRILTFWEIVSTDNHSLLDKDYSPKKKYTQKQKEDLTESWLNIGDEYFTVKNDDRARRYLQKSKDAFVLAKKINIYVENIDRLYGLLDIYLKLDKVVLAEMINSCYETAKKIEPKTKINYESTISDNLTQMDAVLQSMINKFNLKYKQKREIAKKEVHNIYDNITVVEDYLGRSLTDIDKMTVAQWISYEKAAKKKAALLRQKKIRNGK